ncbi:hypothetical protein IWQ57_003264 [Coemansia nantahalensis]|uniref:Uncharacterized protein n=1 Tax=Coemansia nantahalensis TaxID=2789366 RepID=A0ACC1JXM8_9FUNG|nr:hypothetical protein IWQ57_003264 [Coemansia nantahalensis]
MDSSRPRSESIPRAFFADIDINHSANRQALAKGATHRVITEATDAEITTRGRYFADPATATPADPALHLHVEAGDQASLDRAVAMIERMKLDGGVDHLPHADDRAGQYSGGDRHRGGRAGPDASYRYQDKVFLEIESGRGFNVRAKLIGTGGENMRYLQDTTGARVQVRGRGSGSADAQYGPDSMEPMHLLVMSDSEDVLRLALEYCRSLVDTVHAQYNEFRDTGSRRHDRHGNRDGWGRPDPRPDPRHVPQQHPYGQEHAMAYPNQQLAPDAAAAAAYNEYAAYCAQYYQYYGQYPDYSAYYAQADPGAAPMPDAAGQDGYHNVPPPADYVSHGKKV